MGHMTYHNFREILFGLHTKLHLQYVIFTISYLEFNSCRYYDWPEWKRVRTNWRDHDGRHGRMDHRGSGRNRVSRTSGWSRNNQSVSLFRINSIFLITFNTLNRGLKHFTLRTMIGHWGLGIRIVRIPRPPFGDSLSTHFMRPPSLLGYWGA